jgi:hypothetical protein
VPVLSGALETWTDPPGPLRTMTLVLSGKVCTKLSPSFLSPGPGWEAFMGSSVRDSWIVFTCAPKVAEKTKGHPET